jgi:hypothetical protein
MVDVTVDYAVADNCNSASCVLTVSSHERPRERDDDGGRGEDNDRDRKSGKEGENEDHDNARPDWVVIDAHHVRLRAEESDGGRRRIFTITLTCTDAAGNKTVRTATLPPVHDRN